MQRKSVYDPDSFAVLEPSGRRLSQLSRQQHKRSPEQQLVDRADLLTLTAPEMTALIGGLRVLGANHGRPQKRRLHDAAGPRSRTTFRESA